MKGCERVLIIPCSSAFEFMTKKTSLDKGQMKIMLVEGVHRSAVDSFEADGYTRIEYHEKALPAAQLIERIGDVFFVGIRSRTRLTARVIAAARKLTGIACFCIGTNQVDLQAAKEAGIPVFNAPFSNTRSVAELVVAEMILLLRVIPGMNAHAHRGGWL